MRAFVTGGAGFIGSTLVDRLLAEGYEVDVVDDLSAGSLSNLAEARAVGGNFTFHQMDIRSEEVVTLMERRKPALVFHLAAQASVSRSMSDPIHDGDVNIIGTLRVLEGARAASASKVIFAASGGSIYGDLELSDLPVGENAPHHPSSPYAVSKKVAIDYLSMYREQHGLEFSALLLANVYGPRQDSRGEAAVVAVFASMLSRGEVPTINGDGEQTRDFVFVDDVVDAFARAAKRGSGLIANVGTGQQITVNELYQTMAKLAGVKKRPKRDKARAGEVRYSALDARRAKLHLGWEPFTTLEHGLARVLDAARTAQDNGSLR